MKKPRFLLVYEFQGEGPQCHAHPDLLGVWREGDYSFLFFALEDPEAITVELHGARMRHVFAYEDWIGGEFEPLEIGGFLIRPPWKPSQGTKLTELVIDPGVVFGTGLHPTTRHCLMLIEELLLDHFVSRAADLGTGTGILAIALAKRGIEVVSVDNNPLCIEVAGRNLSLNDVQERVFLECRDVRELDFKGMDLIIANLGPDLIIELLRGCNAQTNPYLILSGITRSFINKVIEGALVTGYGPKCHLDDGVWHTLLLVGKDR